MEQKDFELVFLAIQSLYCQKKISISEKGYLKDIFVGAQYLSIDMDDLTASILDLVRLFRRGISKRKSIIPILKTIGEETDELDHSPINTVNKK
ncbi:hypothetical protein pb186bvf_013189 [Paramecium bursaria]